VQIDELIVELKLDSKNFTDGQRKALDAFKKTDDEFTKRLKNLEDQNKKAGESFGNITHAAEGLLTVIAGAGMASYARETVTAVAATGRLAHNIGETTGELSAFGRMIERNGGNADAAMGSLKGFSDQITRLNTLGQGSQELFSFLGTIGAREGSGPLETFMKFAEWAESHKDNPQLVNLIGSQGGFDQGTINEAMKGRVQVLKDLAAASKGAIGPEQVEALTKLQGAWVGLDQALEKTGRDIVTDVAPALTTIATAATGWIERNQKLADTLGEILAALTGLGALKPAAWLLRLLGLGGAAGVVGAAGPLAVAGGLAYANLPTTLGAEPNIYENGQLTDYGRKITGHGGGAFGSPQEKESFIRASAIKAGINPDIAMAVAKSEGFNSFSGDNGTSFGAFQLHVTPGGRGHAVGDQFKSLTGLDPSDPGNEHEGIMFAMEWAKRHGWHDFHGAARVGVGDQQGIGDVTINVQTDSKDPREHGRVAGEAFKNKVNSSIATQANTGLN
jgi:hypothetical protein